MGDWHYQRLLSTNTKFFILFMPKTIICISSLLLIALTLLSSVHLHLSKFRQMAYLARDWTPIPHKTQYGSFHRYSPLLWLWRQDHLYRSPNWHPLPLQWDFVAKYSTMWLHVYLQSVIIVANGCNFLTQLYKQVLSPPRICTMASNIYGDCAISVPVFTRVSIYKTWLLDPIGIFLSIPFDASNSRTLLSSTSLDVSINSTLVTTKPCSFTCNYLITSLAKLQETLPKGPFPAGKKNGNEETRTLQPGNSFPAILSTFPAGET